MEMAEKVHQNWGEIEISLSVYQGASLWGNFVAKKDPYRVGLSLRGKFSIINSTFPYFLYKPNEENVPILSLSLSLTPFGGYHSNLVFFPNYFYRK